MENKLKQIKSDAISSLSECEDLKLLDEIRIKYLGKKGELTSVLKQMGSLSAEQRPIMGQIANEIRGFIEDEIKSKEIDLKKSEQNKKLAEEELDVTMPGSYFKTGNRHPINIVLDEVKDIFLGMGYSIASGPEVELDYYNFEALNIPKGHPARDDQDTFYIDEKTLLRSQTSPIQIRVMENNKPPIRIIAPGRVYRADEVDATHSPVFHQIEGLVVDKGVKMSDLKGTLETFAKALYGENLKTRFRPHHFQFTEPSAELDVACFACGGTGCRVCKGEGWIEVLGGGMVHPKVLQNCNIDPEIYSGFAFGMGLERIVMRRYKINDLRLFYENDIRFISQF